MGAGKRAKGKEEAMAFPGLRATLFQVDPVASVQHRGAQARPRRGGQSRLEAHLPVGPVVRRGETRLEDRQNEKKYQKRVRSRRAGEWLTNLLSKRVPFATGLLGSSMLVGFGRSDRMPGQPHAGIRFRIPRIFFFSFFFPFSVLLLSCDWNRAPWTASSSCLENVLLRPILQPCATPSILCRVQMAGETAIFIWAPLQQMGRPTGRIVKDKDPPGGWGRGGNASRRAIEGSQPPSHGRPTTLRSGVHRMQGGEGRGKREMSRTAGICRGGGVNRLDTAGPAFVRCSLANGRDGRGEDGRKDRAPPLFKGGPLHPPHRLRCGEQEGTRRNVHLSQGTCSDGLLLGARFVGSET
ncbi:hypothetical protein VTK73DRAFT_826 [Phialemonium thermophilum]|uniref:Uncharacterized protein n=1 Tax=Phialemonium thermophilum TaxID=223376 RepID=A0ABR3VU88_9PEZI